MHNLARIVDLDPVVTNQKAAAKLNGYNTGKHGQAKFHQFGHKQNFTYLEKKSSTASFTAGGSLTSYRHIWAALMIEQYSGPFNHVINSFDPFGQLFPDRYRFMN